MNHHPPAMTTEPAMTPISVPKMSRFARLEMTAGAVFVTASVTASRGESLAGCASWQKYTSVEYKIFYRVALSWAKKGCFGLTGDLPAGDFPLCRLRR